MIFADDAHLAVHEPSCNAAILSAWNAPDRISSELHVPWATTAATASPAITSATTRFVSVFVGQINLMPS